ncbi:endonuclease [Pseudomonas putida]|uniref:lambda-exonuclease family protein n=1 Tax=Pseudomonas TaxID=286 RepID=UPI0007DC283F|nr:MULTISPECIES: YqaJ viral recombinase family protein [Pseudomonas]OAS07643.1 endonuclease [Pseudomonas putida]OOV90072.1 endonuclease [Pseudomonas sp. MF6396]QNV69523.1 endonuclease [Pseudomonas sp. CFA]
MAMRIITGPAAQQNSAAWFAWRSEGIGASEAPQIMGTSKFRSSYELFRLRLGIGPPPPPNPYVDRIRARGHQLEPIARAAYERHTGTMVTPIIAESDSIPFIRASLDGYDPFLGVPVEIKCPGDTAHGLALKGIVPPEYVDQVQHQIFVAEASFAHYYSFDGSKGVLLKVPRNQKRIDQILKGELDFWHRLQTGKWSTDEWEAAAAAWRQSNRQFQEATAREEAARAVLLSQMPPGRKRHESEGVSVHLSTRKGPVDWRALLKAHGVDLTESQIDVYRKPSVEHVTVRDQLNAPLTMPTLPAAPLPQSVSPTVQTGQPAPKPAAQALRKEFIF